MDEHERTEDEVQLPDERVEDLEPDAGEADDVGGGADYYVKKHIGNVKYNDFPTT